MKQDGSISRLAPKLKGLLSYLIPVIIFSLALWTLDKQLHNLRSSYVIQNFASVPLSHIGIAVFFMILSYIALTGYDYLAARHINNPLPYKQIARISFISTSISYSVGFNFLAGSSLRYRFYSRYGLTLLQIWDIIVFCASTFWIGFCFVAGLLFTFYPVKLSIYMPEIPILLNIVGFLLLMFLATYFSLSFWKRDLKIKLRAATPT